jgi:hypothetical protein
VEALAQEFGRGYEPAIRALLQLHGYSFNVRQYAFDMASLPAPQPAPWIGGRYAYSHALQFVRDYPRGSFEVHFDRCDLSHFLYELATAFPEAPIAIVSAAKGPLYRLHNRLRGRIKTIVICDADREPADPPRVVLATPFGVPPHFACHCQIMIWLDARHAVHERSQFLLFGSEPAGFTQ